MKTVAIASGPRRREPADRREVLVARAEARALLWHAGELTLHDAVDQLQTDAARDGLVDDLGQDTVQLLLARPFACVRQRPAEVGSTQRPESVEPWLVSERGVAPVGELQRLVDEAMKRRAARGAPQVTVNALYWAAREHGPAAFDRAENLERLSRLSNRQLDELHARLKRITK
jgi:hypothetical protein